MSSSGIASSFLTLVDEQKGRRRRHDSRRAGSVSDRRESCEEPTTGFAPAWSDLRDRRLSEIEPRRRQGGLGGIEPAASAFTEPHAGPLHYKPHRRRRPRSAHPAVATAALI